MMAEFYQRRVEPEFPEVQSQSPANLVADVAGHLERWRSEREQDAEALRLAQFRSTAQRAAMAALEANPTDEAGYQRQFRDALRKIPTPIAQQGRYGAIAESIESQYLWTIASRREREQREALKFNVGAVAENFAKNGVGYIDGTLQNPTPWAAGDTLIDSAAELYRTGADGTPLFSDPEILAKMDAMGLAVLTGRLGVDIAGNTPIETLNRILDPTFDYAVTLPTTGRKPLEFRRSALSDGSQNQFHQAAAARVAEVIRTESDAKKLDYGQQLWTGAEEFLPGNSTDRNALETFAAAQLAREPIDAANLQGHMDNCKNYVERFSLLPTPYARAIHLLVDSDSPEAAVMGAQIIGSLMKISPEAAAVVAKPFDDPTLLRASMLHGLILGGTPLSDAFAAVKTAMAMDVGILQKKLEGRTGEEKARNKFYGKSVTADVYGSDGEAEFRKMVDAFFLTNGGNRDAAIAVARARIDAEFAETKIGADRDWHMPLFGRRRRKFRNTPEAVYGKNSSAIINNVLRRMAPEIFRTTGIPCDLDHIILVPTPATDWAVERGEDPSWAIARRNDDGSTVFYFDRETDSPLTFSLDAGVRQEIYEADLADAAKKKDRSLARLLDSPPARFHGKLVEMLWEGISQNAVTEAVWEAAGYAGDALIDLAQDAVGGVARLVGRLWDSHRARKREILLERRDLKTETTPRATKERGARP